MAKQLTLVSMYYPPDKNGMAVYAQKLHQFLLDHGWQVKLITRKRPRKTKNIFQVNVPSVNLADWRKKQISSDSRTYSLKFSRGVYNILTEKDKVIHYLACWDDHLLLYSAIARRLAGKTRLIITIGGGGERPPEAETFHRAKILSQANSITVFSDQIRDNLVKIGISPEKIIFSPPVVDLKKFSFNKPRKKKILRVLYLGRINRKKGVFDIVKVAKVLENESFEFRLVGEGLDKTRLKKEIKALKLKNIEVLSGISHKDVPQVLHGSDVFLHPTYDDEFPVSLLEALACGLPCVSTPIGEIPTIIKNKKNGFLVSPGDIRGIRKALIALKDFKLRSNFGKRGRKISEDYSEDKILPKFLKTWQIRGDT